MATESFVEYQVGSHYQRADGKLYVCMEQLPLRTLKGVDAVGQAIEKVIPTRYVMYDVLNFDRLICYGTTEDGLTLLPHTTHEGSVRIREIRQHLAGAALDDIQRSKQERQEQNKKRREEQRERANKRLERLENDILKRQQQLTRAVGKVTYLENTIIKMTRAKERLATRLSSDD